MFFTLLDSLEVYGKKSTHKDWDKFVPDEKSDRWPIFVTGSRQILTEGNFLLVKYGNY